MNNDYVIMFDENGQPYIAHAFGDNARAAWGKLKGTATKYLEKVPDYYGKGKSLYLYTTEQVNAFHNKGKQAVSNAAQNVRQGAQNVAEQGRKVAENLGQNMQEIAQRGKTALETAGKNAQTTLKTVRDTISKYGQTTMAQIRGAVGKTGEAVNRTAENVRNSLNRSNNAAAQTAQTTQTEQNQNESAKNRQATQQTRQSNRDRFASLNQHRHKYTTNSSDEYLEASASNMNVPSFRTYWNAKNELAYAKVNYDSMVRNNAPADTVAEYKKYLDDAQHEYTRSRQQLIIDLNRIEEATEH